MRFDLSAAQPVLGDFHQIPLEAIDPELYGQVKDYKLRVASQFRSINRDYVNRLRGSEFYISLKLDGEHAHLCYDRDEGRAFLIRHRGYAYYGLPCLDEAKRIFDAAGVKRALIAGELYVKRPDKARTRVFDVVALTKDPKPNADLSWLRFAPFDILTLDDEVMVDFKDVLRRLGALFGDTPLPPPVHAVSADRRDVHKYYDQWVNKQGAEGLMIRTDLTYRYKLKAEHTIDAAIIGYTAEEGAITSVLTALVQPDGSYQALAGLEKGFSDQQKLELYDRLSAMRVESDYMEVSRFHTPYHMVRPEIVVELSCQDMSAERANGQPVKKAALSFAGNRFQLKRVNAFASLKHCVFIRFREDKKPHPVDTRVAQVTDFVFLDLGQDPAREISFPPVEILRREVFVKQVKGISSVRKFLAWRTNKQDIDDGYTRFAFSYTDYSPGRKEPLKQDVRVSNSRKQILAIYDEFKRQQVKKGWLTPEALAEAQAQL